MITTKRDPWAAGIAVAQRRANLEDELIRMLLAFPPASLPIADAAGLESKHLLIDSNSIILDSARLWAKMLPDIEEMGGSKYGLVGTELVNFRRLGLATSCEIDLIRSHCWTKEPEKTGCGRWHRGRMEAAVHRGDYSTFDRAAFARLCIQVRVLAEAVAKVKGAIRDQN